MRFKSEQALLKGRALPHTQIPCSPALCLGPWVLLGQASEPGSGEHLHAGAIHPGLPAQRRPWLLLHIPASFSLVVVVGGDTNPWPLLFQMSDLWKHSMLPGFSGNTIMLENPEI